MGNGVRVQFGNLFWYATNQPPKDNKAFQPSGVSKWVPASAGKAKAGMVHSVSGWTRGVQVKLWDPLRTRAIPECLRGVITTRCCLQYKYTFTFTLPYTGTKSDGSKSNVVVPFDIPRHLFLSASVRPLYTQILLQFLPIGPAHNK